MIGLWDRLRRFSTNLVAMTVFVVSWWVSWWLNPLTVIGQFGRPSNSARTVSRPPMTSVSPSKTTDLTSATGPTTSSASPLSRWPPKRPNWIWSSSVSPRWASRTEPLVNRSTPEPRSSAWISAPLRLVLNCVCSTRISPTANGLSLLWSRLLARMATSGCSACGGMFPFCGLTATMAIPTMSGIPAIASCSPAASNLQLPWGLGNLVLH